METKLISAGNSATILGAVLAGAVSALLFAVAFVLADRGSQFALVITYFTALPLFLSGLSGGSLAGLIASLAGAAGLFVTMPFNLAVIYIFIYAIPAAILLMLAMRFRIGNDQKVYWYPEGNLLTTVTLYPCIIFLIFVALTSSHPGGLLDLTLKAYDQMADVLTSQPVMDQLKLTPDEIVKLQNTLPTIAYVTPAVMSWAWIFVMIICFVLAQIILERVRKNKRQPLAILDIHLSNWLIYALAASGLAAFLAPAPYDYIGRNIALILGLPLIILGLAVVHTWASTLKMGTVFLVIFYVLLSYYRTSIGLIPLVALLGAIDQWFHIRTRLKQSTPLA